MRLGTSTCLYALKRNGDFYPLNESMMYCLKQGYTVQDANFCNVSDCLAREDWQQHIEGIREQAVKHGIEFSQSHNTGIT